ETHWSYSGDDGPERWAELDSDYALCDSGVEQSPIDLRNATVVEGASLEPEYRAGAVSIARNEHAVDLLDNGHTIQITYDAGSTIEADGVIYELVQFHFHAPSEHTVEGQHYPMEMHFVHQAEDGALAVVGVFVAEGEHSEVFQGLLDESPSQSGAERHLEGVGLDVDAFVPEQTEYFRYMGSLTTPPCSEGVRWIVLPNPLVVSAEQVAAFERLLHDNNRPLQPIGERQLDLIQY
ncbi:MAG: carbonic anhydrase family protein, partial [Gemmatimonadota bacterium]